jgi:hypothetical protein
LAAKGIKTAQVASKKKEFAPEEIHTEEDFRKWKSRIIKELEDELMEGKIENFRWEEDWCHMGHFSFEAEESGNEYHGAISDHVARCVAKTHIIQDLRDEPEIFTKSWLMSHIEEESFWDDMSSDIEEQLRESPESYTGFLDDPEPADDGEFSEDQIEEMFRGYFEDLKNQGALSWLEELGYEGSDLYSQVLPYIDIDEAAEDAIDVDGWEHFVAHYDGESHELNSGVVYWRMN